jgi:hypothetical protein
VHILGSLLSSIGVDGGVDAVVGVGVGRWFFFWCPILFSRLRAKKENFKNFPQKF